MRIILISPEENVPREHELLEGLFQAGLESYHLRKPSFSTSHLAEYIEKIPAQFRHRIMIHSHHELVDRYELRGKHFTEKARLQQQGSFVKESKSKNSTGFHSIAELLDNHAWYDYVFLSPFFDSISKPGYSASIKLDEVKALPSQVRQKLIALGGVKLSNLGELKGLEIGGLAILGTIWQDPDPLSKWEEFTKGNDLTA